MVDIPGSARVMLVPGIVHLNEPRAVFEAMLTGWGRQQQSRQLADATVLERHRLLQRFQEFTGSYPWDWTAGDVEDFTVSLASGAGRLAIGTIRGYHLTLRMFCDYLIDARYEWVKQCRDRFGSVAVADLP